MMGRSAWLLLFLAGGALAAEVEVEIGASRDSLDKGYADWRSAYVEAAARLGERRSVYGMLRETRRFGLDDTDLTLGGYHPLGTDWTLSGELATSGTHRVLPRWSGLVQAERSLGHGWGAQAGLRHTEYDSALINQGIFTVERYWGNYRGAYTHYSTHLSGTGASPSHRFQFDWYYGDRHRVGIAFNRGREVENQGAAGVLSADVRGLVLAGRHWFTPAWALSYEAGVQKQGDLYQRDGIRLGLRHLF